MSWINSLFFGTGVAHCIFTFALVITVGVLLGKFHIKGVSFGITWVLFAGIVASHNGMIIDHEVLHFAKEFGLVLFVYSVGLQVGPSFFSSFKEGGIKLNMLAILLVALGLTVTCAIYFLTDLDMSTMVGIMSGAVTNTPGLGAAQQTFVDATHTEAPSIALGYAVAYPMGVIGIITSMMIIKYVFGINIKKQNELALAQRDNASGGATRHTIRVTNPQIIGKTIKDVKHICQRHMVISRINHENGEFSVPTDDTKFIAGDKLLIISDPSDLDFITMLIGEEVEAIAWHSLNKELITSRIMVTKPEANGKTLAKLGLGGSSSFNVTRVSRAGIDLVAHDDFVLQLGDRIITVGTKKSMSEVETIVGNSMKNLRHPNIFPIFLGMALGILVGSIPFAIPSIPQPVKLGLAGGPLIVSILLSRFGVNLKLATFTTISANLMIREIGIAIFLAAVGLGAGSEFISTLQGGGYVWVGYGIAITMIPALIVSVVAMKIFKFDYFTTIGLIAGSTTNPPALAYSNGISSTDLPAVSYSTVYPLTMFLRVLSAQMLILFFL
ncbi:MAG: putative transporter [Opitutales bacterium]